MRTQATREEVEYPQARENTISGITFQSDASKTVKLHEDSGACGGQEAHAAWGVGAAPKRPQGAGCAFATSRNKMSANLPFLSFFVRLRASFGGLWEKELEEPLQPSHVSADKPEL